MQQQVGAQKANNTKKSKRWFRIYSEKCKMQAKRRIYLGWSRSNCKRQMICLQRLRSWICSWKIRRRLKEWRNDEVVWRRSDGVWAFDRFAFHGIQGLWGSRYDNVYFPFHHDVQICYKTSDAAVVSVMLSFPPLMATLQMSILSSTSSTCSNFLFLPPSSHSVVVSSFFSSVWV